MFDWLKWRSRRSSVAPGAVSPMSPTAKAFDVKYRRYGEGDMFWEDDSFTVYAEDFMEAATKAHAIAKTKDLSNVLLSVTRRG